jgi:hypothetical protein
MTFCLVRRRTVLCPTPLGWVCLLGIFLAPFFLWWFECEAFLSQTQRLPAEVLVVEGWIGKEGIQAAGVEFKQGGYRYVVTTGGLTNNRWDSHQWSYAEMAKDVLLGSGISQDKIIMAQPKDTDRQRTFASAAAVRQILQAKGILPTAINVFTFGAHARRSRLIFAKAFQPGTRVGVISWTQPNDRTGPWWRSSERAQDVIKETAGYTFEVLLNSGRASNSPHDSLSLTSTEQP